MAKGIKINLTEPESFILDEFIESLDTRSAATRKHMTNMYKNFVNDVGLGLDYTQEEINSWINNHEHRNPNNNCRYFLKKFGTYLGKEDGPLFSKKIKHIQPPKNRKIPRQIDIDIMLKSAEKIDTKHTTSLLFKFYLRLIWEGGLRKSEPLSISLSDMVIEDEIPKVLIRGKGNRHRWVVLSHELYNDIVDYFSSLGIIDKLLFIGLSVNMAETIYRQVCRIANKETNSTNFAKINAYTTTNGRNSNKQRNGTYITPVFSLHKFRTARATQWYKDGVSLIEISKRLGHQSTATTQRYIDEEEIEMLRSWSDEKPRNPDEIRASRAIEEYRNELILRQQERQLIQEQNG